MKPNLKLALYLALAVIILLLLGCLVIVLLPIPQTAGSLMSFCWGMLLGNRAVVYYFDHAEAV